MGLREEQILVKSSLKMLKPVPCPVKPSVGVVPNVEQLLYCKLPTAAEKSPMRNYRVSGFGDVALTSIERQDAARR